MISLKKQCLSEFLCGLLVGFFGLGCLVLLHNSQGIVNQFEFSLLFGLAIAFVVVIFNPMSGAQFNPGVTLAMVITHRQDKRTLLSYWVAQFLGWFCGAMMVYGVFYNQLVDIAKIAVSGHGEGYAAVNLLFCNYNNGGWYAAIPLELILTAFMVIIILASNDQRIVNKPGKALFPLVLALYITFAVTFAGPYSGACLNAARDFGPRLWALVYGAAHGYDISAVFGNGYQFLLYLFVPTIGAVLGALIYDHGIDRLLPLPKILVDTSDVINDNYVSEKIKEVRVSNKKEKSKK